MSDSSAKRPWVPLVLVSLAVGVLVFWWLGRRSAPDAPPPPMATANSTATPTGPQVPPAAAAGPSTPAVPPNGILNSTTGDPRAALARALALPDPRQRAREFGQLMQEWLARDFEGALAYVRTLPRGPEYSQALLMALELLAQSDPDRALRLANELATTRDDRLVYNVLFDHFAREGVPAAISRLALVPTGEARENSLRALTDAWVTVDAPAALAWGRSLTDVNDRRLVLESALLDLAQREPLQALEAAPRDLDGAARDRVFATALRQLNETDPARAASFLDGLPRGGEAHTLALIDVARAWVGRDAPAALAWVQAQPAGQPRDLAFGNLFQVWSAQAPDAAALRAAQLPSGPTLDRIAPVVAATLAQSDAPKAIAWAAQLSSDSARAAALVATATAWSQRDPGAALAWAATLSTPSTRDSALVNAYANWQLQNSTAARAWLDAAPLAPEVKARLR